MMETERVLELTRNGTRDTLQGRQRVLELARNGAREKGQTGVRRDENIRK